MPALDERSVIASISFCVVIKLLILYEGENRKDSDQANLSHNSAQPYAVGGTSTYIKTE